MSLFLLQAAVLMQTYAELMSAETVSFQERYQFDGRAFAAWQLEVSANHAPWPAARDILNPAQMGAHGNRIAPD
jgi:hypothetical protein